MVVSINLSQKWVPNSLESFEIISVKCLVSDNPLFKYKQTTTIFGKL